MSDPDELVLAAEFPPASYAQWRALAEQALKGARFEDRLRSRTADDLTIEPLYERAAAAPSMAPRTSHRWQVMQRIDHPDPTAANVQTREDLVNGADGLVLVGAGAVGAYGFGLPPGAETVERVLESVPLDGGVAIEFDLSPQTKDLPAALAVLVKRRGIDPAKLNIRFGFDPIGAGAFNGGFPMPWAEFAPLAAGLALGLAEQGFTRALLAADGRIVHGAGGSEGQELAYVLATAVAYLRALESAGIALADARRMVFFRLAADTGQFLTIAKFRALRRLWARVEESCGLDPEPAFIGAETAWRTMNRDDPYANIIRATIAAFAAGIGGADAITVLPFTAARGLPDAFARRLARNTSLVPLDEANLGTVADPTAGTGWSEDLTDKLCHVAWALFQEIERSGGIAEALQQGLLQRRVGSVRERRVEALRNSTDTLVGANEFRAAATSTVAVLDVPPVAIPPMPVAVPVDPLRPIRLAHTFEGT